MKDTITVRVALVVEVSAESWATNYGGVVPGQRPSEWRDAVRGSVTEEVRDIIRADYDRRGVDVDVR